MRLLALGLLTLLVAAALAGCASSGQGADSDQDGLLDSEEKAGWDVTVVGPNGTTTYHVSSDPTRRDTSGAGLPDLYKAYFHLDPHAADTDGDGLSDCQEVRLKSAAACADPSNTSSDSGYRTRGDVWDTDGDGLSDGVEVNTYHSDPLATDSDADGLNDGAEIRYGGNPIVKDTDGDGCMDGVDPFPDVRQTAAPGFLTLRAPSGSIHLLLRLADSPLRAPATGEWQATGSEQDAKPLEPAAVPPGSCGASPDHPWVAVDFQAARGDGSLLDFTSLSNPGGATRVFWNQRADTFSWSLAGSNPFSGPLDWKGVDGAVRFAPRLLKDDNQNP